MITQNDSAREADGFDPNRVSLESTWVFDDSQLGSGVKVDYRVEFTGSFVDVYHLYLSRYHSGYWFIRHDSWGSEMLVLMTAGGGSVYGSGLRWSWMVDWPDSSHPPCITHKEYAECGWSLCEWFGTRRIQSVG